MRLLQIYHLRVIRSLQLQVLIYVVFYAHQQEYRDRLDAFYSVRDELNCERTYQVLRRMDRGEDAKD